MTLFLLVRHGTTDAVGKIIAGRLPGYPLNERGYAEATALASSISTFEIHAAYASPLERAQATAEVIASPRGIRVATDEALTDIDFGAWNARAISDLESDPAFRRFNEHRAFCPIPNGERVSRVQARMVDALARMAEAHPGQTVLVVSHGDPIRLAVAFYVGLAVDHAQRLQISTASITALELNDGGATLHTLNSRSLEVLG